MKSSPYFVPNPAFLSLKPDFLERAVMNKYPHLLVTNPPEDTRSTTAIQNGQLIRRGPIQIEIGTPPNWPRCINPAISNIFDPTDAYEDLSVDDGNHAGFYYWDDERSLPVAAKKSKKRDPVSITVPLENLKKYQQKEDPIPEYAAAPDAATQAMLNQMLDDSGDESDVDYENLAVLHDEDLEQQELLKWLASLQSIFQESYTRGGRRQVLQLPAVTTPGTVTVLSEIITTAGYSPVVLSGVPHAWPKVLPERAVPIVTSSRPEVLAAAQQTFACPLMCWISPVPISPDLDCVVHALEENFMQHYRVEADWALLTGSKPVPLPLAERQHLLKMPIAQLEAHLQRWAAHWLQTQTLPPYHQQLQLQIWPPVHDPLAEFKVDKVVFADALCFAWRACQVVQVNRWSEQGGELYWYGRFKPLQIECSIVEMDPKRIYHVTLRTAPYWSADLVGQLAYLMNEANAAGTSCHSYQLAAPVEEGTTAMLQLNSSYTVVLGATHTKQRLREELKVLCTSYCKLLQQAFTTLESKP